MRQRTNGLIIRLINISIKTKKSHSEPAAEPVPADLKLAENRVDSPPPHVAELEHSRLACFFFLTDLRDFLLTIFFFFTNAAALCGN